MLLIFWHKSVYFRSFKIQLDELLEIANKSFEPVAIAAPNIIGTGEKYRLNNYGDKI